MTRPNFLRPVLFALLAAASSFAVGLACDGDGSGGGGETSGDGGGGSGAPQPCTADAPCPDGQFCLNGACLVGCQTDANCADNQYCDTDWERCQNREVPSCQSDADCLSSQVCVQGLCSTPPSSSGCNLSNPLDDSCPRDAICLDPEEDGVGECYSFPPCGQDGSCPVGAEGAACNDGLIPNKDRICLPTVCDTADNCPSGWSCVRVTPAAVVGQCSSGAPGEPCTADGECASGLCDIDPDFGWGICA